MRARPRGRWRPPLVSSCALPPCTAATARGDLRGCHRSGACDRAADDRAAQDRVNHAYPSRHRAAENHAARTSPAARNCAEGATATPCGRCELPGPGPGTVPARWTSSTWTPPPTAAWTTRVTSSGKRATFDPYGTARRSSSSTRPTWSRARASKSRC
ncbi:hypothetical protein QJS66_17045 [Kocuria rhizophila]|nr:hypothetical protein QJS66_17045 [Kocuria rhizophila]